MMPNGDPQDGFFYPTYPNTHDRFLYYLYDKGLYLGIWNMEIMLKEEILNQQNKAKCELQRRKIFDQDHNFYVLIIYLEIRTDHN